MTPEAKRRISKLNAEIMERSNLIKFIECCRAEGLGSVDAEEDRFYSHEQAAFFREYEQQMQDAVIEPIVSWFTSRLIQRRAAMRKRK